MGGITAVPPFSGSRRDLFGWHRIARQSGRGAYLTSAQA